MFIARHKKPTASENAGDLKAETHGGMFIAAYVVFQRLSVTAHVSKHSHAASHLRGGGGGGQMFPNLFTKNFITLKKR